MPAITSGEARAKGKKHRKPDPLKIAQRELNRLRAERKALSGTPSGGAESNRSVNDQSVKPAQSSTTSAASSDPHRIQTLRAPVPFGLQRK